MMLDLFQGRRTLARADLPRSMPEARAAKRAPSLGMWTWFTPDENVPAYGLMEGYEFATHKGLRVLKTKQFTAGDPRKTIWVNDWHDVAAGRFGLCALGLMLPVWVLVDSGSPAAGEAWGPRDSTWTISKGYPGFTIVGGSIESRVFAVRSPGPTVCVGSLKGALESASETAVVDNVVAMSGLTPVANSAAELTVQNAYGWDADDNAKCEFRWHEKEEHWRLYQVECPA